NRGRLVVPRLRHDRNRITCNQGDSAGRRSREDGGGEVERVVGNRPGNLQIREGGNPVEVGIHRQRAATQRSAAARDRRRDLHSVLAHRIARCVLQLKHRLPRERDCVLGGTRGLGRDRQLGGSTGDSGGGECHRTAAQTTRCCLQGIGSWVIPE